MSEYVIMPKADYVAACDAIREKTGKTDLIKSGDMRPEILGITTGGGSSEDVRYVTFMSEDGTVELGKKAVATGDDCADPIARGIFSTPTKESTDQYNFTFSGGWATTPGGGKDANALKAVTEDRTVYANFIATVRYYTITYYDSDGTTVLKTESLAYGSMPSYEPISSNDNYMFDKWSPDVSPVTGNVSYIVVWKAKPSFETLTWAEIKEICDAGNHATTFAIGNSKPVTLTYENGTSETIRFTIVDMDVDLIAGNKKAPLTLMAENIVAISPIQPASAYNKGNFDFHSMDNARKFLNQTLYGALPEDLQTVITPHEHYPYGTTTINMFIAHVVNLGLTKVGSFDDSSLKHYKGTYKHFANGASVKRTKLTDASVDNYWTSACGSLTIGNTYNSAYFNVVDGTSVMSNPVNGASSSHGIVPCFCI